MNNLTFVGNLVRDPELRAGQNGRNFARFTIAVNEGQRGTDQEKSYFLNCTVFNGENTQFAENVVNSLKKGNRVVVTGRLNQWTEKFLKNDGSGQEVNVTNTGITVVAIGPDLLFQTAQTFPAARAQGGAAPVAAQGQPVAQAAPQAVAAVAQPVAAQPGQPYVPAPTGADEF